MSRSIPSSIRPWRSKAVVGAVAVLAAACGSDSTSDAGEAGAADEPAVVAVTATDDGCTLDQAEVASGEVEVTVTNQGQQVTEVYVYGEGDRVVGEVENVTPGLTRGFRVTVGGGPYEVACKPGMVGDGIRATLTVTGAAIELPDPTRTVAFEAFDFDYTGLQGVSFTAGDVVEFTLDNVGEEPHEFEVFGPDGVVLGEIGPTAPGDQGSVVLVLGEAGTYRYVCGIDDHEDRGMAGTFEVA